MLLSEHFLHSLSCCSGDSDEWEESGPILPPIEVVLKQVEAWNHYKVGGRLEPYPKVTALLAPVFFYRVSQKYARFSKLKKYS